MNLDYSNEQEMLRDSVSRMLAQRYPAGACGDHDGRDWHDFVELGLTALPIPEAAGGMGGAGIDCQIVFEAMGRHLAAEPYLACVVQPAAILSEFSDCAAARDLAAAIAEGSVRVALAHDEENARYELTCVATAARREADRILVTGRKIGIAAGPGVERLIVSAREWGEPGSRDGLSLFVIPVDRIGVELIGHRGFDGLPSASARLTDVPVDAGDRLGPAGGACHALEKAQDAGVAAICGEAVGLLEMMLEETVSYLKTRQQFGGPIGRFQALQHRAAEMFVSLEQARSMALLAAMALEDADPVARRRSLSSAKTQINASLRFVGQQAVQLHGGIGVTEECTVGRAFKRTTMLERLFGDSAWHLARLDRLGGLEGRLSAHEEA